MTKRLSRLSRFTLIELMMVMAVIIVLVAAGVIVGPLINRKSSESKTRALLQAIQTAMEQYKNSDLNGGNYPISPIMVSGKSRRYTPFYMDNFNEKASPDDDKYPRNNMAGFFDLNQIRNNLVYSQGRYFIADAFFMPFLYLAPGQVMGGSGYDLVSTGADGYPGAGDEKRDKRYSNGIIDLEKDKAAVLKLGQGDDISNFGTR